MNKFERVLSDDDLVDIFALGIGDLSAKPFDELVKVLEQAIINKLKAEQEPVATVKVCRTNGLDIFYHQIQGLYNDMKLYAHPMPSIPPTSDKPVCVSESAESDTQTANSPTKGMSLGERVAHVGGRENKDGYIEFGSVMAVHALISHVIRDLAGNSQGLLDISNHIPDTGKMVGADHIPDSGKMITPLAQRKIQTLLDKGEYRVIENATVLVNKQGHAAIVNHGGAFYWVDNDGLAREFDAAGVRADSDHIADMRKMIPEGWQLVPKNPTEEMLRQMSLMRRMPMQDLFTKKEQVLRYENMLAAAPKYTGEN